MKMTVSDSPQQQHLEHDTTSLAKEAAGLLDGLSAHDVLYYPMADLDSAPVGRGGHLADVFVVCDWRWPGSPDAFDRMISELLDVGGAPCGLELFAGERSFELPAEQVRGITGVSEDFGLFHEPAWVAGQQPWGRVIRLKRRSGAEERLLWLIYITGNAVEVYEKLFIERGAAPKVLWLDCPLGADVDRWAQFISPSGEFGQVFCKATRQPEYVVAQRQLPGWKQTIPYQRLSAWHRAWALAVYGLPDSPPL
ncbi:MAG: hypothetical protein NT154_09810 [Verrucomicrobia bacterium]|nr:hypothetical protein [Verrucomicrobiota bacterium]